MRRLKTTVRTLPILIAGISSGTAMAAGFQLWEQNASGLGNAYAGSAAVAENASTVFFNPAGMTYLPGRQVSLGVNAIQPSFKFHNEGSTNPPAFGGGPATGGEGGDGGDLAFLPNAYLSWALTQDLYFGLGIGAPFGLKTEYDSNWVGRYQATLFDVKTINVNPSVAYRVNDMISLGAGVSWQRMEAKYTRQAIPTASGQARLDVDDDSWGWNVGAMFQLSPSTRLGASYRSTVKHELEGTLSAPFTFPASTAVTTQAGSVDVELPDTFILSVHQQLTDRWEMLGDVSWTGWSSLQKLNIKANGVTRDTLDLEWRDTYRVAFGGSYKYDDAWKFKFGLAYDQSPIHDDTKRIVSLPDKDRWWLSLGAQWKPFKDGVVDVGYTYVYVSDPKINNNGGVTKGTVTGTYDASVHILGAQYTQSF